MYCYVKPDGADVSIDKLPREIGIIVETIEKNIKNGQGADNIILYVHGRGKEPTKS